jgi:hypothetical protein
MVFQTRVDFPWRTLIDIFLLLISAIAFRHHIAQDQPTSPSTIQIGRNPEIASSKGFSGPSKGRHAIETLRNRQEELTKSARLKVRCADIMIFLGRVYGSDGLMVILTLLPSCTENGGSYSCNNFMYPSGQLAQQMPVKNDDPTERNGMIRNEKLL